MLGACCSAGRSNVDKFKIEGGGFGFPFVEFARGRDAGVGFGFTCSIGLT